MGFISQLKNKYYTLSKTHPDLYLRLSKLIHFPSRNWQPSAIRSLDQKLLPFIEKNKDIFFIQVGSNDGITNDHLRKYYMQYKWKGLLIEPIPFLYEKLIQNNAGNEGLIYIKAAIGKTLGMQSIYKVDEKYSAHLPHLCFQLASFRPEVILKHKQYFPLLEDHMIVEESVNVLTFDYLVEQYKVDKIDILQIDTEGYDYEILKTINFSLHKPSVIIYEHAHLNESDYKLSVDLLRKQGYKLHMTVTDTIAIC